MRCLRRPSGQNIVVVIESHNGDRVEWGISFSGPNPGDEDYFAMPDEETAFKLASRINALVSSSCKVPNPLGRTTDFCECPRLQTRQGRMSHRESPSPESGWD